MNTSEEPVGLLTINAPRPRSLSSADVEIVKLFTQIVQTVNLVCKAIDDVDDYAQVVFPKDRRCTHET
ncbi:hypothetical protein FB466_0975 [Klugiella xanthotipulae]|uniref:Uncharacterized protein n=1 Tax=Klugiella xanthotipulae TaxID=244735 RepID=A0A543I6F2_9MICO|nr:hypothetical protein FB466_0975 [Klugiella xanthotipulae]